MPKKTNFSVNGSNYYRVTATVGKNPDGSPIRKQFYGDSKKAAEQKRDEFLAGLRQGLSVDYQKNTVAIQSRKCCTNFCRGRRPRRPAKPALFRWQRDVREAVPYKN